MGSWTAAYVLAAVLITSALSGAIGMAGGVILMSALALVMPAAPAIALHGLVQLGSNGWRIAIHRRHVRWRVVGVYVLGALATMAAFTLIAFSPSRLFIFLALGLMPIIVWLPERWIRLDANRPPHALVAGIASTTLSLTAGVNGAFNDLFFIRTDMTRHEVISTKAAVQVFGHLAKVVFYGAPLMSLAATPGGPPAWLPLAALPMSMVGALLGSLALDRMSDANFRDIRRWLITGVGALNLVQAARIILHAQG